MFPVRATYELGCAFACLGSVCLDNGIDFNQQEIVKKYLNEFPQWQKTPGLINYNDTFRLAKMVGLASWCELMGNPSKEYIEQKYQESDTVGILLVVEKFYTDERVLFDTWHCVRLEPFEDGFNLMNPSTYGNQIKKYSWEDIRLFIPTTIVLKNGPYKPWVIPK